MDSRKKLYKVGARTDSGLNRRVLKNRANQNNKRRENFDSHRNLPADSPCLSAPVVISTKKSQLQEYRMQRNIKKVTKLQEEKVPFFTVVPSGVWLEKEEPAHKQSKNIDLNQTPVRTILMSSRSVTKKTVEKIIRQTGNRRRSKSFTFTPKILQKPSTKIKKHVLTELNTNVHKNIPVKPVKRPPKPISPKATPQEKTPIEIFNPNILNETFELLPDPDEIEDKIPEVPAHSPQKLSQTTNIMCESPPPNLEDSDIFSSDEDQSNIVKTYRARFASKKQVLLTLIEDLENLDSFDEEKKLFVYQVQMYLRKSKPREFIDMLKNFDKKESEIACKQTTEEDIEDYWFIISKEMDEFKKTLQKKITDNVRGSVARRRSKRSLILDTSHGPKRSLRLLKNSETPKHNSSCYGCTSITSASKTCTPKSARRRTTRMISENLASPTSAISSPKSAKSNRKLFDLDD